MNICFQEHNRLPPPSNRPAVLSAAIVRRGENGPSGFRLWCRRTSQVCHGGEGSGGEWGGVGGGNLRFLWQLPLLFNPHGKSPLNRAEARPGGRTRELGTEERKRGEEDWRLPPSSRPVSLHTHGQPAPPLDCQAAACRQTARLPFCAEGG